MKIFVTGVNGQLGHDCMTELAGRGHEVTGSDIQAECALDMPYVPLDITDPEAVRKTIGEIRPDAVIHCAAWTAVDAAEEAENREKTDRINRLGTQYIAEAVKAADAKMIYISTDYVFDGKGTRPWEPDDKCYAPLNVYGQSKLAGELAVANTLEKYFIVRIAWVFGLNGKNFVKTMIRAGKTHDTVRVVCDQIGTPTYTPDLARLLAESPRGDDAEQCVQQMEAEIRQALANRPAWQKKVLLMTCEPPGIRFLRGMERRQILFKLLVGPEAENLCALLAEMAERPRDGVRVLFEYNPTSMI